LIVTYFIKLCLVVENQNKASVLNCQLQKFQKQLQDPLHKK